MNQQIWYGLCLLFVVYNLKLLVDDRNQINYVTVERTDKLYSNKTKFLLCSPFAEIKQHDRLGRSGWPSNEEVSVQGFLNRSIRSIETSLNLTAGFFNRLDSCVFNLHVCFNVNQTDLENGARFGAYLRTYFVRLFAFSKSKIPFFYENINEKTNAKQHFLLMLHKQKVYDERYLSNAKCFNHLNQYEMNRFLCLNDCYKQIKRFERGFYAYYDPFNPNEATTFNLSYIAHGVESEYREPDKKEFDEKRKECLRECPENDCFWETYNTISVRELYYELFLEGKLRKMLVYTTIYLPIYSNNDLLIQIFSFLTLFTGSSIVVIVPLFITGLVRKLNLIPHGRYVRLVLPKIQLTTILFSLAFVLNQTVSLVNDFKVNTLSPNRTSVQSFSFEIEPVSLVLCFPIEVLMFPNESIRERRNSELLQNNSFDQIEQLTNSGLDRMIKEIGLNFGPIVNTKNLRTEVSSDVMFKNENFKSFKNRRKVSELVLTRCFRLNLHVNELRYNKMVPFSFLFIHFRTRFWKIFIIDKNQKFDSSRNELKGEFLVAKFVFKYSKYSEKSNCADYRERKGEFDCGSRHECIDRCINKRFLAKHHQITTHSTVHKEDFRSFMLSYVTFNETKDPAIEKDCLNQFKKVDCSEVRYEETLKPIFLFQPFYTELNLNFENTMISEIESSSVKLWMDVLTLVCLFFGLNLTSLLMQSFSVLKRMLGLRWYRMYGVIIALVCLTGFLTNQLMLFKEITQSDLKDDGHFKKLDAYFMPNSILCFLLKESEVDRNFQITGRYLDSISELTYERVFDRIRYWNGTHLNMVWMNATKFTDNRFSNGEIELKFFLYLNLKCFEIELKPSFREIDYSFFNNKVLLEVNFNENFTELHDFTIFLYRQNGSKQFSGMFAYEIGRAKEERSGSERHYSYQIMFEMLEITREDQYEFLKRPLSLFYETISLADVTKYIENIKRKFTETYRLATREILIDDDRILDLEYNDELFKQFFVQKQNQTDHFNPTTLNFRQSVYNSYTQADLSKYKDGKKTVPDFSFALSLGSRQTLITNDQSVAKLVINILNSLSFFLNICILDLFPYLRKLGHLVDLCYESLLRFRGFVRSNLSV